MELFTEHFMAIALFFSFILLIFYGFPVAWTMGGLGVLFIILSMLSDSLFDTFYGVDWGFASMVVYRLYGVMANWVLVALPMFIFMGIMMDKSGIDILPVLNSFISDLKKTNYLVSHNMDFDWKITTVEFYRNKLFKNINFTK